MQIVQLDYFRSKHCVSNLACPLSRTGGISYCKMFGDRYFIRRAQVKVGLINLCKGLFSLNSRIYYKLKSGT
jgi:hypothetical protein